MANILAVDVGYGHVKWVALHDGGEVKRGMFPSVAPITTRERTAEAIGMSNLRAVTVGIGINNYVIGRDAYLEADASYSRSRLADYSQTDGYHALMLGALSLSGMRDVDQLVIGLPLSTLPTYHAKLQERYTGEHAIGATHAKRKVEVNVRQVNVSSQPAGAMVQAVSTRPELRKTTNLVIDMGYYTMDFLMCEGLRPYYTRSGAIQGGMSAYYDHLGHLVIEKLTAAGLPSNNGVDHFRLEEALGNAKLTNAGLAECQLRVGSKMLDISDCVQRAQTKLTEYVDRMVTTLGGGSLELVSSIVMAGGGGRIISPAVKARIGDSHEYLDLDQSQFAIANGYALFGAAAAKRAAQAIA